MSKPRKRSKTEMAELVAKATDKKIMELEAELSRLKKGRGATDRLKNRILAATKKTQHITLESLSRLTGDSVIEIEGAIEELYADGQEIAIGHGQVERLLVSAPGKSKTYFSRLQKGDILKFGVLGDNQLGNKHSRLDVAQTAYDHFESEGIEVVYHSGNLVDGYHPRFNAHELIPEAGIGIESQSAYAGRVYPRKKGITTYFITGECHEGWWAKKDGINVGRTMESRFQLPLSCLGLDAEGQPRCRHHGAGYCPEHGRDDLVYIGHEEADLELRVPHLAKGARGPMVRIIHPGGGTAYALSYKTQKLAESLQGGEKPQIQFVGHFHKFDYNYHREIHNVMTACLCDQTIFMRKLQLAAHVGYLIAELFIGRDGVIEKFKVEWVPWYDQGFYKRYETWSE